MSKNTKKATKTSTKKMVKKSNKKKIVDSEDADNLFDKESPKKSKQQISKGKPESDFDLKFEELREALRQNYIEQKRLMTEMRELITEHKKEIGLTAKTGNRSGSTKHSGFNKPEPIPAPIKALLKIKEDALPRSQVTALMYKYFTDNKMYNPETKKEIIPNQKIKEIFGMKEGDVINFYNLQTWLKNAYAQ